MTIHNFKECLKRSIEYHDADWWGEVYKKAFPDMQAFETIDCKGWAQTAGIDRIIILKSGKIIYVDEKVREKTYNDFLLEYWSCKEKSIPGWVAKDLMTDYIAYAFAPSRKCYLLPFQQLRKSWILHHKEWVKKYFISRAKNEGYTTIGVCVPINIVMNSITEAMIINWV